MRENSTTDEDTLRALLSDALVMGDEDAFTRIATEAVTSGSDPGAGSLGVRGSH